MIKNIKPNKKNNNNTINNAKNTPHPGNSDLDDSLYVKSISTSWIFL